MLYLIYVNNNQMVNKMSAGGKRVGAGRPHSEKTKQVRIPISMSNIARELCEIYRDRLVSELELDKWFESAPAHEKTRISIDTDSVRIGTLDIGYAIANKTVLCIYAIAKHPNGEYREICVKI